MVVTRTILLALIAISLALLPVTGEAGAPTSSAEMSMTDHAVMPCCQSCITQDGFKSSTCALKCMALAGAILPTMTVAVSELANGSLLAFVDDILHGLVSRPPTHPPPV